MSKKTKSTSKTGKNRPSANRNTGDKEKMAKNSSSNTNASSNNGNGKSIGIALGSVAVAAALMFGGFFMGRNSGNTGKGNEQGTESSVSTTEANKEKPEYMADFKEIVKKAEKDSIIERLRNEADIMRRDNHAVNVQLSETDVETYVYNTKGEVMCQSSDGNIVAAFLANGKSFRYNYETGAITIDSSVDFLKTSENVLDKLESGEKGFTLYETGMNDTVQNQILNGENPEEYEGYEIREYVIDVEGEDAVRAVYDNVGNDYAENLITTLKTYIGEDWVPHFEYGFIVSSVESEGIEAYCNLIINNEEQTNWVTTGFIPMAEWQIASELYDKDFTDSEQYEDIINLIDDTLSEINKGYEMKYPESIGTGEKTDAEDAGTSIESPEQSSPANEPTSSEENTEVSETTSSN